MINENIQLYIDDVLNVEKLENNSIDLIIINSVLIRIIKQKSVGRITFKEYLSCTELWCKECLEF